MTSPLHTEHARRPLRHRNIVDQSNKRFGPTMTPMVDVVLVILIFFMASTTIAGHEWFLNTDLPEQQESLDQTAGSRFALPDPTLRVEVFAREGEVLVAGIGNTLIPLDEAVERIGGLEKETTTEVVLLIAGSDEVLYRDIMLLHDAASNNNMRVAIE